MNGGPAWEGLVVGCAIVGAIVITALLILIGVWVVLTVTNEVRARRERRRLERVLAEQSRAFEMRERLFRAGAAAEWAVVSEEDRRLASMFFQ